MAKKEKEKAVNKKNLSGNKAELNIKEFMILSAKEQDKKIKETLDELYEGTVEVEKKHIEKVLNVAFDNKDNETYLPESLRVQKNGNKLLFSFKKRNHGVLILFFALALLGAVGFSSYAGIQYLARLQMNIDLDGDGIADLNIDLDDDGICDLNCDTNRDRKPDVNIDYHGNRKAIFNILTVENGKKVYKNRVNIDTNGDGVCDLNCDSNSDGWPDYNIDYDGDGVADLDRDINGDKIKDLDIDLNGDGVCDLNCDDNKDNVCDRLCSTLDIRNNGNGTSSSRGNGGIDMATADLIVTFDASEAINISKIYPDDQNDPEVNTTIPDLKFTVQNTTDRTLYYNINWVEVENNFETTNFWCRTSSTNRGYTAGWATCPFESTRMASRVAIAPNSTQSYTISFTLHGTGEEQNEDQGKAFKGRIAVELLENRR